MQRHRVHRPGQRKVDQGKLGRLEDVLTGFPRNPRHHPQEAGQRGNERTERSQSEYSFIFFIFQSPTFLKPFPDDYGMLCLKLICGADWLFSQCHTSSQQTVSPYRYCPFDRRICSLRTGVDLTGVLTDDTGLNSVELGCCQ